MLLEWPLLWQNVRNQLLQNCRGSLWLQCHLPSQSFPEVLALESFWVSYILFCCDSTVEPVSFFILAAGHLRAGSLTPPGQLWKANHLMSSAVSSIFPVLTYCYLHSLWASTLFLITELITQSPPFSSVSLPLITLPSLYTLREHTWMEVYVWNICGSAFPMVWDGTSSGHTSESHGLCPQG